MTPVLFGTVCRYAREAVSDCRHNQTYEPPRPQRAPRWGRSPNGRRRRGGDGSGAHGRRNVRAGFSCGARLNSLFWLKLCLIVYLLERDAEPVLFSPYDAAMPFRLVGLNDQGEFVGNG
jgi:hypothetical protein